MFCGYQTWSEESLMQVYDDDLHRGQRSSEVKCSKLCAMVTKLGQKNPWCKFKMLTFMQVKGHQRSNGGKLCAMATIFGQKNHWCKFKMMMTFMEVKGHMESNIDNYVPWLQNLVRQSVITMMTCIEVKGQQRSNVLIYVIWQPYLVRYTVNTR